MNTLRRNWFIALLVIVSWIKCSPAIAQRQIAAGDSLTLCWAINDTLSIASHPSADSCIIYRWLDGVPTLDGVATKTSSIRPGAECYLWISDSTDVGDYSAYWVGVVDSRTPIGVYNFEVTSPPSGPQKVNLWFLDSSDSLGIANVDIRIKDEDQVATLAILESNSSGKVVTALPADTAQVIAQKLGAYTFTVPSEIIVSSVGLTDTIWGTAFDPGTPDSANVTRIYSWCYNAGGTPQQNVIITATPYLFEDWGTPGTSPTANVLRGAKACTTNSAGKFNIDLVCADQILPEGGSTGNVRYIFDFGYDGTWVAGRFVGDSDTLYIPCTLQKYNYWDAALRP